MRHSLPTDLINKILGFLNLAMHPSKSFAEVKQLLEEIQQNALPVQPESPAPAPTEKEEKPS